MMRRPPRSTLSSSSAASDVYKRQGINAEYGAAFAVNDAEQMSSTVCDAAMLGDLNGCKLAKKNGADMGQPDQNGNTPLHYAVLHRHPAVVHFLLTKAHADVHAVNRLGNTPLHLAAGAGDEDSVQYLLAAGSCVLVHNSRGDTPLHLAALKGFSGLLQCIAACSRERVQGNLVSPQWAGFLKHSCDEFNTTEDQFMQLAESLAMWRSLAEIERCAHDRIVRALVAKGAPLHAANMDGKTAFSSAMPPAGTTLLLASDANSAINQPRMADLHNMAAHGRKCGGCIIS
eukprot:TRINITY_DN4732_c0_g1_i1.p1 TRINITY_DN4732_c0_g1~~TRINITY_DN4732_c0_g1_i1.p1  ORF type:complete len:287 (+),score=67.98 TRINITY_DN4732_c0_g1_i1:80-940(+)